MVYPIIIGGERRGKLSISREGLYTLIEAELPDVHEGLHRLWLHGGGESAYLGLMQPWSGGMYLRRKLSRQQLAAFPKQPEYAADRENISLHNANEKPKPSPVPVPEKPAPAPEEAKPEAAPQPETPQPALSEDLDNAQLQWFRRPDGTRLCFDGRSFRLPR